MTLTRSPRRAGFSLVELLATMALAVALMSLAVGVAYSGAFGSQRVVTSADRVSGWLLIAKQRALRDGQPRGVRFLPPATTGGPVTEAVYIEVPEPWVSDPPMIGTGATAVKPRPGRVGFVYQAASNAINSRKAFYISDDTTNDPVAGKTAGQLDLELFDATVQAGDSVAIPGLGTFRITAITSSGSGPANSRELTLASYPDLGSATSSSATQPAVVCENVSFQRAARPVMGEPLMSVPPTGAIDGTMSGTPNGTTGGGMSGDFDVLFAPNGKVLGTSAGLLVFWVRDTTRENGGTPIGATDFDNAGEQVLVVLYPKTGAVATQPVNPGGADYYQFAKDGINAGF